MYLHLGNDVVVHKREILAVFDLDNSSQSHLTRAYLSTAEQRGEVINTAGDELPKSFVICSRPGGGQRIYLSQLNSSTLSRRAEGAETDGNLIYLP